MHMIILTRSMIIRNLLIIYRKKTSSVNQKKCPEDDKTTPTKKFIKVFDIKKGE